MPQLNYIFDTESATRDADFMDHFERVVKIALKCKRWRRAALISYGLFMASAVLNLIQFLGR